MERSQTKWNTLDICFFFTPYLGFVVMVVVIFGESGYIKISFPWAVSWHALFQKNGMGGLEEGCRESRIWKSLRKGRWQWYSCMWFYFIQILPEQWNIWFLKAILQDMIILSNQFDSNPSSVANNTIKISGPWC